MSSSKCDQVLVNRPCVQEIEAKTRVNLVVLGVTKTLNF